ncbi:unnamed protein product [Caenorhabditis angaria]|uniref:Uncharacterized protein n=1 Tax=Caenorhabditis angaria TaxID=860376 RepID=A0A9P1MXS0_9PELO|nr:unnamed protein product [Caenorhabditis angaria]
MPTFGYSDETNSAGYVTIPFIDTIFTQIEKWAPIFKSKLSNWILTKEQRKISTESTPIFIPLVVALFNGEPLEKISRRHLSITIGVLTAYALLAKVSGIYTHPYYA